MEFYTKRRVHTIQKATVWRNAQSKPWAKFKRKHSKMELTQIWQSMSYATLQEIVS